MEFIHVELPLAAHAHPLLDHIHQLRLEQFLHSIELRYELLLLLLPELLHRLLLKLHIIRRFQPLNIITNRPLDPTRSLILLIHSRLQIFVDELPEALLDAGLFVGAAEEGELAFEEVFGGVQGQVGLVGVEGGGELYGLVLRLRVGFVQGGF